MADQFDGLLVAFDSASATVPTIGNGTSTWPALQILIAFGSEPDAETDIWTDVTADVHFPSRVRIGRGRDSEIDEFRPGRAGFVLVDTNRTYDPLNTASVYYGNLVPGKRVRIRARYSGTTYTLFTGYLTGFPQQYDVADNVAFVPIDCYDELSRIVRGGSAEGSTIRPARPFTIDGGEYARLDADNLLGGTPTFSSESSGERVTELLQAAGVLASRLDVDGGDSLLGDDTAATESLSAYLQKIVDTELGRLFVLVDGTVAFWERKHWSYTTAQNTSQATFSDQAASTTRYAELELEPADDRFIRNLVRRGIKGGDDVVRVHAASRAAHGLIEDSKSDLLFASLVDAAAQADYLLGRYAAPLFRVRSLTVLPGRAPSTLFPHVLGREIGDRVTVTRTPVGTGAAISQACWVERVEHTFDSRGFWSCRWMLSEAETRVHLTLDDDAFGLLDSGNTIAY